MLAPWKKSYDKSRQHIKKHRHYFVNKGPSSQSYGFSSSHVWMWELDYKESWTRKNGCFWTVVLENTLESPLDCKEIQSVNPKEISPEYSLERLMLKLKLQYFGHLVKELTHWKRPWCWEWSKAGGAGDDRDGWMASPTQWTWVWASSGSWWWIRKPGMLQSIGLQRVGHDWTTELNWAHLIFEAELPCLPTCISHKCPMLVNLLLANFKEIKQINPKGSQPWIFIGRTDAETEAPILWSPNVKNWLIGKDPNAGKYWREVKEEGNSRGWDG